MKNNAVVFDFDDTLVATHKAIWDLHKFVAKKYFGRDLTDIQIAKHWGRPIPELIEQYYGSKDIESGMQYLMMHKEDFPKAKLSHINETLAYLRGINIVVGIVSATTRPLLDFDAELAGIPIGHVDYIQTAEDTEYHKPDGRVFDPLKTYLSSKNITSSETLYVGDGLFDFFAAKEARIPFLGVTTGLVNSKEFTNVGAESISSLGELESFLIQTGDRHGNY